MSCPIHRPNLTLSLDPATGKGDLKSIHHAMEVIYDHMMKLREFKRDLDEQIERWLESDGGETESMKRLNYQLRYHAAFELPEFTRAGIDRRQFDGVMGIRALSVRSDQISSEIDEDIASHCHLCTLYIISSDQ
jgi:hypothetical protein